MLTVIGESIPWADPRERLRVTELAPNFWRATARYGFMERPDVPALLAQTKAFGCTPDLSDVTYYVGHETIVRREDGGALHEWETSLFGALARNAAHVSDFFCLPTDDVVEIGRQIAI